MPLQFRPLPYENPEPTGYERGNQISQSLNDLGSTINSTRRENRLSEQQELERQIQMLAIGDQYGDVGLEELRYRMQPKKILRDSPGMVRPLPVDPNMAQTDPMEFQRRFGSNRLKMFQDREDRGLQQRLTESQIAKNMREPETSGSREPNTREAYLMREVNAGRMTFDQANEIINRNRPGALDKPMTPENAGKLSMATSAIGDVDSVINSLINEDGTVNRGKLFAANFSIPFVRGGIPFTEGRSIDSAIENAIAAKLRAETGAAATPEEIRHVSNRFRPKMGDDDATIINKLSRLRTTLASGVELADPIGSFRETQGGIPEAPARMNVGGLTAEEESELRELERMFGGQ